MTTSLKTMNTLLLYDLVERKKKRSVYLGGYSQKRVVVMIMTENVVSQIQ